MEGQTNHATSRHRRLSLYFECTELTPIHRQNSLFSKMDDPTGKNQQANLQQNVIWEFFALWEGKAVLQLGLIFSTPIYMFLIVWCSVYVNVITTARHKDPVYIMLKGMNQQCVCPIWSLLYMVQSVFLWHPTIDPRKTERNNSNIW